MSTPISDEELNDFLTALDEGPVQIEVDGLKNKGRSKFKVRHDKRTALVTDAWHRRECRRIAQEWADDQVNKDELTDEDMDEILDAHTAAFEPVHEINEHCEDQGRRQWYERLLKDPEFRSLHESTKMDPALSSLASRQLFKSYREYVQKVKDEQGDGDGKSDGDGGGGGIQNEVDMMNSVRNAARHATKDVDDAENARAAFGLGAGEGSTASSADVLKFFKDIQNNRQLRNIVECAGRMINSAMSLQQTKTCHGVDDVVGVELSNDISRALPSELMALDTELEDDFLRRLIESQVMCREYRGKKSEGRGPIMVMVDESGSMHGNRIIAAKGFALAMAWLARSQNRWCCLVGWACEDQARVLTIEPGQSKSEELMEWCSRFWDGGTDPPLSLVPQLFEDTGAPSGHTDVIWITDGECDPEHVKEFNEWREDNKVKVWTIGMEYHPEAFEEFSDVVTRVEGLNTSEPIVKDLLSL